MTHMVRYIA